MKFRTKILILMAIVVGVFALMARMTHESGKSAVAAYRKQLVERGEKLNVTELAPHFTADEQQAARDLLNAAASLGSFYDYPPTMSMVVPGHAMVSWKEAELPTTENSNIWPVFRANVSPHEDKMVALRDALKKPVGGFDVDYSNWPTMSLMHLALIKHDSLWTSKVAVLELHDGEPDEAWTNLMASVAITRVCEREPLIISLLVRIAMGQLALNSTWEALQYPHWEDAQLEELQNAWASVHFTPGLERALEMERATLAQSYDWGRRDYTNTLMVITPGQTGAPSLGDLLEDPQKGFESIINRYPRYWAWKAHWSYREELYNAQVLEAALETTRTLETNVAFAPALKGLETELGKIRAAHTNAIPKFINGGDDAVVFHTVQKAGYMEVERQLVMTAIALKRFQIAQGKYPAELKELVPKFLAAVPLDPMDDEPLRYRRTNDVFVLYSVGENGVDDGGDPTPNSSSSSANKQWFVGRDAVWPMPATPEEVMIYKQKTLATANWMSKKTNFNPASIPAPAKTN